MTPWISFQRIRVCHAITGNRLRLLYPITLTVPPPTDYSGVMSKKRMCLGTFSRLARSLATVYIFARVRIFGTSVPFSDPISDISHTFSVLFPAILYIFRPALNLSPLNHQHAIQRIFEIFEIERDFKPSDSST